jgi:hypothetical protein
MARRNPERCYRFTALKRKASFSSSGSLLASKKSVVGACFACVSNRGEVKRSRLANQWCVAALVK